MEENNKQQNKRPFVKDEGQKFYFNEEGKLVVESNKGIWVDGEPNVKMYDNFQCDAKTLGIIINKFKGVNAQIGNENTYVIKRREYYDIRRNCDILEEKSYCIIGLNDEEIEERIREIAEEKAKTLSEKEFKQLKEELNMHKEMSYKLQENINKFNELPWWKRIFKKVEV